ncbi:MAG TPA: TetR/AcrR family transcriptional regulator [Solirubrobacteraceae bacterium]|nr:TetR/AcrR family transcriptional regulator [Solirubrobacteraceae bacterium]
MTTTKRLTRDEQRARTRARLIASARTVFARRGYHRASLEDISEEAGYSTGAIYSNFDGKEDLFLAVLERHVADRVEAVHRAVAAASTPAERVRAAADDWMRFLREDPDWYPLFIEFWAYAVRDPQLRDQVAERFRVILDNNAGLVRARAEELGVPVTDEVVAMGGLYVTALADGLALIKLLDPGAVPDEFLADAMSGLAAVRPGVGDAG